MARAQGTLALSSSPCSAACVAGFPAPAHLSMRANTLPCRPPHPTLGPTNPTTRARARAHAHTNTHTHTTPHCPLQGARGLPRRGARTHTGVPGDAALQAPLRPRHGAALGCDARPPCLAGGCIPASRSLPGILLAQLGNNTTLQLLTGRDLPCQLRLAPPPLAAAAAATGAAEGAARRGPRLASLLELAAARLAPLMMQQWRR